MPTLATKSDLADLKADLHKMDASIKTWMIATVIGLFLGFGSLFLTITNSAKPGPGSPQVPPVIINNIPASPTLAPVAPTKPSVPPATH